jgi:hypothetical protein
MLCLTLLAGCREEVIPEPGPKDAIYKFSEFTPGNENYDSLTGFDFDGESVYMLINITEAGENGALLNGYLIKSDLSGNVIEKNLLYSGTAQPLTDNAPSVFISQSNEDGSMGPAREVPLESLLYDGESLPDSGTEIPAQTGESETISEDKYYSGVSIGPKGEIYLVRATSGNFPNAEGKLVPGMKTEIVLYDNGTETVLADISERLAEVGVDASFLYIDEFLTDEDGIAYITVNMNSIYAFDLSTGEMVFENKEIPQGGSIRGLYKTDDGVSVVTAVKVEENGETLDKLNMTPIEAKKNDFGNPETIDASNTGSSNIGQGDNKYSYYGFGQTAVYGYKKGNRTLVADLPASGVNLTEISRVIPVSETQFLLTGFTHESIGIEKLFMLTKVDPKDVPDKSFITVAAVAEPNYLAGYITEFMLTRPQFHVEYKQYAVDSTTTFDEALIAFNNDMIAGNIPDVIVIAPEMPYDNYIRKGMLADLYPFLDSDPDYKREDFLQPILKAFETDGKLYSFAPAFDFNTLVGKTSIFGEEQGQSFEKLQAAAKLKGASLFSAALDRDVFTERVLTRMARGFIDEKNAVCSFDSDEFIEILEYAKTLPAPAADAEPFEFSFKPGETNDYKTDKTLVELLSVYDFRHFVALEKMEFGEPVTFLGYPNDSGGSGIEARTWLETAITSKAKNPDGAWEFVKGTFSYKDYWTTTMGYPPLASFPTLLSELEIAAEKTTIPPYQFLTGSGIRIKRVSWLGADLSNQPDNTEADNAKMYELFGSIDGIVRRVPAIEKIIAEETAVYYAGNKTAEETAKIIQNRATTYLEETK